MRILICEDSVLLREGLVRLLEDAGHEVVAALTDTTDLRATVASTSPDLCILDVRLPPTFTDEGIRAALVWNLSTAELAREHNDANVISIGARQHGFDEVTSFIDRFIATPFSGEERHVRRIGQIAAFERDGSLLPDPRQDGAGSADGRA